MLCSEFKKPGGGKGRPGRGMRCQGCGVTWESHGIAQRKTVGLTKRRSQAEIAARILEIEVESEKEKEKAETTPKPMVRKPLSLPTAMQEFEPIKLPETQQSLDGATDIVTSDASEVVDEESELEIENIPMAQVKKETIKAKLDLYEVAAGIFR